MTFINTDKSCKFCAEVSKNNGEDPIGSARKYKQFLLIQASLPWSDGIWLKEGSMPKEVINALQVAWDNGINFRPLAIASDEKNPLSHQIRVLSFCRPTSLFAIFERKEYLIPPAKLANLVTALLSQPEQLSLFQPYEQNTDSIRDLLICTHGSHDISCGRFGYPIYKKLKQDYEKYNLRIWRCSHFGGHQFAPTLIDLPTGHYWGHLEPNILDVLIHRQGSVAKLRSHYRGWAGLDWAEQIAEREIWIKEGWDWLTYLKSGETLAISDSEADYPDWAEVKINFCKPDGSERGVYEARIEAHTEVETMWNSGDPDSIETIKQYHVTRLIKSSCK
ncbi:MAG: hypothetical protein Kow0091_05950 [Geminocystis sp.]